MTDFDDDEVVVVGQPLPRITAVQALDERRIFVSWHEGARAKEREVVDLGAVLARFKLYTALRDDDALFVTVHAQGHGYGIAWGDGSIDMASTTVADAADETMTAEDFTAFMDRHGFTLDRVAAELGISRRMAAYYKRQARVPRTVALACRYIDGVNGRAEVRNAAAHAGWETAEDLMHHVGAYILREDVQAKLRPSVRSEITRIQAAAIEKAAAVLEGDGARMATLLEASAARFR